MDKPWKVVTAFLVVFVAGAVFGGVFMVGLAARRQGHLAQVKVVERTPPADAAATATAPANPALPKQVVAGIAAGLPPGALTPQIMRQFTRRLTLTAAQEERVRPFIARAGEDLLRLRQENLADSARVTERMYEDISAVLTSAQRTELEKMRVQMQERVRAEQERGRAERLKRAEQAAADAAAKAGTGEAQPVRPKAPVPKQGAQ